MAKSSLPAIYVKEAEEKNRLFYLGNNRTSTGNPTFTSTSSSTTYDVATYNGGSYANQGENGMLLILQSILVNYEINAAEYNLIENNIAIISDELTNLSKTTWLFGGGLI